MTFAENLKRICEDRGTTPTALCKELGLSTSKVSAWYGGSLPKQEVMVQLAQKLECSVMDFFADEVDFVISSDLDEDEKDIIVTYRKMDRKAKHEFMARIFAYADLLNKGSDSE